MAALSTTDDVIEFLGDVAARADRGASRTSATPRTGRPTASAASGRQIGATAARDTTARPRHRGLRT